MWSGDTYTYLLTYLITHTRTHVHTHSTRICAHFIYVGEWSSPQVKNRPQPMGVITFTRISNNKAVIYAGNYTRNHARNYESLRSDDLYVFDLVTKVTTHVFNIVYNIQ